jgi:SAM-dependent methyltransferase
MSSGPHRSLRARLLETIFRLLYSRLGFAHEAVGRLAFGASWDARRRMVVPTAIRGRVIDIGCGEGILASQLSRQGASVAGIEPSATMARRAARRKMTVVRATAQRLPLAPGCASHVICTYPGPWIASRETWNEIARVMEEGGSVRILLGGDLSRMLPLSPRRLLTRIAYGRGDFDQRLLPELGHENVEGCYVEMADRWGVAVIWTGTRNGVNVSRG